jgi:hypothetical protein
VGNTVREHCARLRRRHVVEVHKVAGDDHWLIDQRTFVLFGNLSFLRVVFPFWFLDIIPDSVRRKPDPNSWDRVPFAKPSRFLSRRGVDWLGGQNQTPTQSPLAHN